MERLIQFQPAWDKRSKQPGEKDYGIHGVNLRMVLKGPLGAVQFVLFTNWHLPHVQAELQQRPYDAIAGDPHWMERPIPADLGYHSPVPRYDGQDIIDNACECLDGRPCYYDGSGLNAERIYDVLRTEGDAGVWRELEAYYRQVFE